MMEWPTIIAGMTGILLGILFFGGLWRTTSRLSSVRHPALWMLASMLLRFAIVLAGFLLLARHGGLVSLLIALASFVATRLVIVRKFESRQRKEEPCN